MGTVARDDLYQSAVRDFGRALDRLAFGYEANPDKRHDLRQEIHFQLWRSFDAFDNRCSLKTWTFRVAHNTAVSWIQKERRSGQVFVDLEAAEQLASSGFQEPNIDHQRALQHLAQLILKLKPLDRQIMICHLEDLDATAIAEITGLSTANVATKLYRIKAILARRFPKGVIV